MLQRDIHTLLTPRTLPQVKKLWLGLVVRSLAYLQCISHFFAHSILDLESFSTATFFSLPRRYTFLISQEEEIYEEEAAFSPSPAAYYEMCSILRKSLWLKR